MNPSDPTTIYVLGVWHFEFADLSTMTRSVASAVLAEVPKSNYNTALDLFLAAESIEPDFFINNTLMIGKCYARLKKNEDAKPYLDKGLV